MRMQKPSSAQFLSRVSHLTRTVLTIGAALLLAAATLRPAQAAEQIIYLHNDIGGSPVAATDANGDLRWKEHYRPYGAPQLQQAASAGNRIGFAGKAYDRDTQLSYFGARYYDPILGRFQGVDPKEVDPNDLHSFNRYAYANNNPYRYVDPDGNSPLDIGFLIFDTAKLAVAIYTGVGVREAAFDFASSVIGVASPIPGTGQAIKMAKVADKVVDGARAADKAVDAAKAEKTFQSYTKTNSKSGEVYCGRTSGCGTALENVASRDASHHMSDKGFGPAVLDKSSGNAAAIRGREQQLIDANGGARSSGGKSGNTINGISPSNPNRGAYMDAAKKEFGQ